MKRGCVTLVTPSHAGDLERFLLQRESIERCGIDLPHIALVDDEDIPLFQSIPFQRGLTLLSSRELLPPAVEARRKAWGARRRELRYWLHRPPIHGWYVQQLLKLGAASRIETEGMVCLDSDTFFVGRAVDSDFFTASGKLHLYASEEDNDVEMAEWVARSMDFLGVSKGGQKNWRYTHSPVPLHVDSVRKMQAFITDRHKRHWMDAMALGDRIMEYSTYGVFARNVLNLEFQEPVVPSLCTYYWWPTQAATLADDFLARVKAEGTRLVLINSNIGRGVGDYRALVEQTWPR